MERNPSPPAGFTLAEVMVSTLLLGLIVTAVMSMLRNAREYEADSEYRRQARLIAFEALEDTLYHYSKAGVCCLYTQTLKLKYLEKSRPNEKEAHLTIQVTPAQDNRGGKTLKYFHVESIVSWPYNPGPPTDTLRLSKRVYRLI